MKGCNYCHLGRPAAPPSSSLLAVYFYIHLSRSSSARRNHGWFRCRLPCGECRRRRRRQGLRLIPNWQQLPGHDADMGMQGLVVTKGFSLVEVMISLVLLSFLMMGTYVMVDNSQRTKETVSTEDRAMLQVQMAFNRLEADFSQIYSPAYFAPQRKRRRLKEIFIWPPNSSPR